MRNASGAFKQALAEDKRDYINQATITLTDGTVLEIDNEHIWENGVSIEDAVSAENTFQVGAVIINQAKLVLNNIYDDFSAYDFTGASVVIYVGLEINGEPELLKMGTYEVDETEYNGAIITLTCLDNMAKFDKPYTTQLVYPATLQAIVLDAYKNCLGSNQMGDQTFPAYQYQVAEKPSSESTTYRQVLSWAAQIAGCFARCDKDGKVRFGWYNTAAIDNLTLGLDGGEFDGGSGGIRGIEPYLDTTDGMTMLASVEADDQWFSIPNSLGIAWGGTVYNNIYIDSDSCICFANSEPVSHGHSALRDINICTRDGKIYRLWWQLIDDGNLTAVKIRWLGYTQYSSSSTSRRLSYELFITADGRICVNFLILPDPSYRGTSSIIESEASTTITPALGTTFARRTENGWSISGADDSYQSGDTADGGSFEPWNIGYDYDAGSLSQARQFHIISSAYSHSLSTDDVVITGVKVVKKTESDSSADAFAEYTYGDEGYMIAVEGNEFIQGNHGQDVADTLGAALVGLTFRKAEITHPSDPTMEAGDVGIYYDRKGNRYTVLISETDFTSGNSQRTCSSAETPRKNSAQRYSEATRTYVEFRKQLLNQEEVLRSEWEAAEADLVERIENASGLFQSFGTNPKTGSGQIWRFHDKQDIADSNIVIMFSDVGITLTSTYQLENPIWYGMTVDGVMIASIMNTIGLNFDWGTGGTLTLGGQGDINGLLKMLDASGNEIGRWSNAGISLLSGLIQGPSIKLGGANNANGELRLYDASGSVRFLLNKDYIRVDNGSSKYTYLSYPDDLSLYLVNDGGSYRLDTRILPGKLRMSYGQAWISFDITATGYNSIMSVYASTGSGGGDACLNLNRYAANFSTNITCNALTASGTKSREVSTKDYGDRLLYCYETPSPMFGDVGEGEINQDGICYIQIDPVFAETVSTRQYQVFLQAYGDGKCYVRERHGTYFIVAGEPGLQFGWEIKGKQSDYDQLRLEKDMGRVSTDNEQNYAELAHQHISEINAERQGA